MSIRAVPAPAPQAPRRARPLWRELAGAVLRERRQAAGLRLRDVAERAGMSVQYLSELERGRKEPSSEMLESICGALDLDLLHLVDSVGLRLAALGRDTRAPMAATGMEEPATSGAVRGEHAVLTVPGSDPAAHGIFVTVGDFTALRSGGGGPVGPVRGEVRVAA